MVEPSPVSSASVPTSAGWQDGYNCRRQCRPSLLCPTGFASTHRCCLPPPLLPPPSAAASLHRCCLPQQLVPPPTAGALHRRCGHPLSCRIIPRWLLPLRKCVPPQNGPQPHATDPPDRLRKPLPPMVFPTVARLYRRPRPSRTATNSVRPTHTRRPPSADPNNRYAPLVTDGPPSCRPHTRRGRCRHRPTAREAPAAGAAEIGGGSHQGRDRRPVAGAAAENGDAGRQRGRRRRPRRQRGWRPAAGAAASGGGGG